MEIERILVETENCPTWEKLCLLMGFPSSQRYGFSNRHVWMWELDYKESWAPKNWCFWTVVLEKTLESPLDCKEIKPVHPEYSLEGLMLNLKLQYFGHLMWRTDPFEKTMMWERLKGGGEGDDRGWDGWMVSPAQWTWVWVNCGSWPWTGRPGMPQSMGSQRVGHNWGTELHWTDWIEIVEHLENPYTMPPTEHTHILMWKMFNYIYRSSPYSRGKDSVGFMY